MSIEIRNLRKLYGDFVAVDDLSLAVAPGEIFGFLGPNGAGKTTTIRVVAGLSLPTLGRVRTREAREILESAASDKELVVRNAVNRALREAAT